MTRMSHNNKWVYRCILLASTIVLLLTIGCRSVPKTQFSMAGQIDSKGLGSANFQITLSD
jgi:hypothetical protein